MYISRKIGPLGYSYRICESYFEAPFYKSRVILDLGENPQEYITYYSEVSFSVDIEEELLKKGYKTDQFELEKLFFPFLKPEAKRWVQFSLDRKISNTSVELKDFNLEGIHWFDRLRFIVLKLDHRKPKRVLNFKFPFLKRLLNKSRDEIENFLWDMEDRLTFLERNHYILTIFSLDKVNTLEERDERFLSNLCEIAKDPGYYMDLSEREVLSNYLSRYVWMYFDRLPWRKIPRIYQQREISLYQELAYYLNLSLERLLSLEKREVLKVFRKKILEIHPDRGGTHEEFIKIRKLMEDFLKLRFN